MSIWTLIPRPDTSSCSVILFCPKTTGVHLADAVLHIAVGAPPLHSLEGGECLSVPRMGLLRVSVYANTVRKHPAQVVYGQSVAAEGLLHEEAVGLLMILGRIVIPMQKSPCPLVPVAPHHDRRRFVTCLPVYPLVLPLAQDWRPRRPETAPGYPPA